MQEPYYWYVLYVRTNTEKKVMKDIVRFVEGRGFSYDFEPFCPETEYYYRNKRENEAGKSYRKRPLFPNYVFLETTMPQDEFVKAFGAYLYNADNVIRLLKSGDGSQVALPFPERQRLEYLLCGRRCLEHSIGVIVGDNVIVQAGPLKGFEGNITRINRHNRYAEIAVDMFGGITKAQVALEVVEKR